MFRDLPRAMYPLSLTNTGERLGYYILLSTFVLFLQAKYGFDENTTGLYYALYLSAVYFTPLLGGWIADRIGYGKCITIGILLFIVGYGVLAIPTTGTISMPLFVAAIVVVSIATGFFRGNLQVLFGNVFEQENFRAHRDTGFSLNYMMSNIGSMFGPAVATKVTNVYLAKQGLYYNANACSLAHQLLSGNISPEDLSLLQTLANKMHYVGDMATFSRHYLDALSFSYNIGFLIAAISLSASLILFFAFRPMYKHADYNSYSAMGAQQDTLTPAQTRSRIIALCTVFAVIIFFWMAFHQNGTSLTYFARDYTQQLVGGWTRAIFDIGILTMVCVVLFLLYGLYRADNDRKRAIYALNSLLLIAAIVMRYRAMGDTELLALPQQYQQFNPFFVIALTPLSLLLLNREKGSKEISAPTKFALGMLTAGLGYVILIYCSVPLPDPSTLDGKTCPTPVVPHYIIATYLVLTLAELLLSPMGLSFVSKVAPLKYKGLMMGCWYASGAIGNYLSRIPSLLWNNIPLWLNWTILSALCFLSAAIMFAFVNRINEATK